jgi:hypothetical protein
MHFKSYLFLFIASTLYSINVEAQLGRFGLNAGLLYSDWENEIKLDSNINYEGKIGASVGFYFVSEISDHWNLDYAVNIAWKGFKMNGHLVVPGVQLGANLVNHSIYIDLPITMRYIFGKNTPQGFFIKGGVQFSFLVYNKIDGSVVYNGQSFYGDPQSNADELHPFDLSVFPAIGYQFESGLNFQFLYQYGLINIIKNSDYLGIKSAHNSILMVQVGIDL